MCPLEICRLRKVAHWRNFQIHVFNARRQTQDVDDVAQCALTWLLTRGGLRRRFSSAMASGAFTSGTPNGAGM
jgi:hypothetical protein